MEKLRKVFDGCRKHKIYINLNDSCLFSPSEEEVDPTIEYIGFIYSVSSKKEVFESLSDEGSSIISYRVTGLFNNGKKIRDLFCAMLITYNFRPFLNEKTYYNSDNEIYEYNVDIVITDEEFPNFVTKTVNDSDEYLTELEDDDFEEEVEDDGELIEDNGEEEKEVEDNGELDSEKVEDKEEVDSEKIEDDSEKVDSEVDSEKVEVEEDKEDSEKVKEDSEKVEEDSEKVEEDSEKVKEDSEKVKEDSEKVEEDGKEEVKVEYIKEEVKIKEKEEEKGKDSEKKVKRVYKKVRVEELSKEEIEYAPLKKNDLLVICEDMKITHWGERSIKFLNRGDLIKAIVSHKLLSTPEKKTKKKK